MEKEDSVLKNRKNVLKLKYSKETICHEYSEELNKKLSNELKHALRYLLCNNVESRIPFYKCFSEKIKVVKSKDIYYVWDENTLLWKIKKISELKNTDLKRVIEKSYDVYRNLIEKIEEDSIPDLLKALDNSKIKSLKNVRDIELRYIEEINDEDFKNHINPRNSLATKGGEIVDLKTKLCRKRNINDYWTQETDTKYNPNANSDLLNKVINEIFVFDEETKKYYFRILGSAITGLCLEGKIYILYGKSDAGKSILINLLNQVLGHDFSTIINKNILLNKKQNETGVDPFVHVLANLLIGIINETDDDDYINPSKTKVIASNEPLAYRLLFSNKIELLESKHTILLTTNNIPQLDETTEAMWKRLELIPFTAKFKDKPAPNKNEFKIDPKLKHKLNNDDVKESLLKIIIDNAYLYNKEGMGEKPEKIKKALEDYKIENDPIKSFLDEYVIITDDPKDYIKATELYQIFKDTNLTKISQRTFNSRTSEFLGKSVKKGGSYRYLNVQYSGLVE
jgi:putative DNA primase/helicase